MVNFSALSSYPSQTSWKNYNTFLTNAETWHSLHKLGYIGILSLYSQNMGNCHAEINKSNCEWRNFAQITHAFSFWMMLSGLDELVLLLGPDAVLITFLWVSMTIQRGRGGVIQILSDIHIHQIHQLMSESKDTHTCIHTADQTPLCSLSALNNLFSVVCRSMVTQKSF